MSRKLTAPPLDASTAEDIIRAYHGMADEAFLKNVLDAIELSDKIGNDLNDLQYLFSKIAHNLDSYSELMTTNNSHLFEEADDDIWKLMQTIHRDANRYGHFAGALEACTGVREKKKKNTKIPAVILSLAVDALIEHYEKTTHHPVTTAKAEYEDNHEQTEFIHACLTRIAPQHFDKNKETTRNMINKIVSARTPKPADTASPATGS